MDAQQMPEPMEKPVPTEAAQAVLHTGTLINSNVPLDHNKFLDYDACSCGGEGRIWLPDNTAQPSGGAR